MTESAANHVAMMFVGAHPEDLSDGRMAQTHMTYKIDPEHPHHVDMIARGVLVEAPRGTISKAVDVKDPEPVDAEPGDTGKTNAKKNTTKEGAA